MERRIGINVCWVNDWTRERMFADVVKQCRMIGTPTSPFDMAGPQGADGWPSGDFGTIFDSGSPDAPGTYSVSFTGQANISPWDTNFSIIDKKYNSDTNKTTATFKVPAGSPIMVAFTNTKRLPTDTTPTGITNLKIMRPTTRGGDTPHDESELFSRGFLDVVKQFEVVRFMHYFATINSDLRTWSQRRKPIDMYQSDGGGPDHKKWLQLGSCIEYAVMLCNEAKVDGWFNIPALADDDYILKLAQAIAYGTDGTNPYTSPQDNPVFPPLDKDRKIYTEWSCEVWNYAFREGTEKIDLAKARLAAGNTPLNYDGQNDPGICGTRLNGLRAKEISDIFRSVFGDSQMLTRVRPLLLWQYNNLNATASIPLQFLDDYFNNADGKNHVDNPKPVKSYIWGGGGAWYGGVGSFAGTTVDAILGTGMINISGTIAEEVKFTAAYGLHHCGYEGGWVVGGDKFDPKSAVYAANFDPRARFMTHDTVKQYFQQGGSIGIVFNAGSGNYAQADNVDDAFTAPKLLGYQDFRKEGYPETIVGVGLPPKVKSKPLIVPGINAGWAYDTQAFGSPVVLRSFEKATYEISVPTYTNPGSDMKLTVIIDGNCVLKMQPLGTKLTAQFTLERGIHGLFMFMRGKTFNKDWVNPPTIRRIA